MSCGEDIYYLDSAATTPVDAEVVAEALPYFASVFYNPASAHALGQMTSGALLRARRRCREAIGCKDGEVYFTSGGTEAINWAIKCAPIPQGGRIIVSTIEHDAVVSCAERMSKLGYTVDTVMPESDGTVLPQALEKAIGAGGASLVCVMTVNNIVGTVQPIKELASVAHAHGALFFTDAVQAVNCIDIDVADTNVDMLAVSGHKFYAPKGIGFLYVKRGVDISPLIDGGTQEDGMRAGTVNVFGAVAIAEAITRAQAGIQSYGAHASMLSSIFLSALGCGEAVAAGPVKTPDILCVRFPGVNGGRLAAALSMAGVCCSVGSACSAGSEQPPAALTAMGYEHADECVRFSFGKYVTLKQAVAAAEKVGEVVAKLSGKAE